MPQPEYTDKDYESGLVAAHQIAATTKMMAEQLLIIGEATTPAEELVIFDRFEQKIKDLRDRHGLRGVDISMAADVSRLAQSLGINIELVENCSFQLSEDEIETLRKNGEVALFNRYADLWGCTKIPE